MYRYNPSEDVNFVVSWQETLESNVNAKGITEMITILEAPDCHTNSPCEYYRNCKENCGEYEC